MDFDIDLIDLPLFRCDGDGRLERWNQAFSTRFAPAVGRPWQDGFVNLQPVDALAAGSGQGDADWAERRDFIAETNLDRPEYTCHRISLSRGRGQTGWQGVVRDTTTERELRAEFEAVFANAVDPIIVITADGVIEAANEATGRMFGFQSSELIGRPVDLLMPVPHRSRHQDYVNRYLASGEARIIGIGRDLEASHRDGTPIPIHLTVSEIKTHGERRFAGILRDLSAQREAMATLEEQRARLAHVGRLSVMGEMTASIAHEINQPLAAIAMYAQSCVNMIDSGTQNPARLRDALQKLSRQSLRAGDVIERIQRFTRGEETERQPVDLGNLVRDLTKLAETDARLNDMRLTLDLEDDLPVVECDPIQIQQVLLNLVRNAIDVMNEVNKTHGDEVLVRGRRVADGWVEVGVVDSGIGVSEAVAEKLFTPFNTTKQNGMGMGLSICRSIITDHEGTLSFRNNPDHGATFYFRLPVSPDAR